MTKTPSERGSITLVALCFVTVMAIGLASYLALSGQSMKLSNRTYAKDISKHLTEKGLEVALLALKTNNWDDWTLGTSPNQTVADWTLNGTTASCTITYPSNSYGSSGFTTTTKIRVDNYNAYNQPSSWNSTTSYKLNDVVSYTDGMWYRCMASNTNTAPTSSGNIAYWAPTPIPWTWNSDNVYSLYDVVNYQGIWYRCVVASLTSTTVPSPTNTNWVTIPKDVSLWDSSTPYSPQKVVNYNGVNYRCIAANTNQAPPNSTYWSTLTVNGISLSWSANVYYNKGAIVYNSSDNLWYYCDRDHDTNSASDFASDMAANASNWIATTGTADYTGHISWRWVSSNANLFVYNDTIYYQGNWYRYISTSTTSSPTVPPSNSRWELALSSSWAWAAGNNYNIGDVVYRNSSFYRCILTHDSTSNVGRPPNTTYWSTDPLLSPNWDSAKTYGQFDTVRYHGAWYLSLTSSNSNQTPTATSSTYWAVAPRIITTWDSDRNYSVDELVSYGTPTVWYRCIKNTTSYEVPTNTTYWSPQTGATGSYAPWSSTATYAAGNYVSYGGVWYKCILAPTANQSPNNSTYWSASWTQSSGNTTGAPVIYAEGNVTMPDSAVIKTQIRATASPAPLFPNAVGSSGTITTGGSGTIDSYDASQAAYTAGSAGYSATLASNYSSGTAVTISSTTVQGYVAAPSSSTTPYAPLYSSGGALLGNSSVSSGIDLTRISRSPYVPQFDILPAIQHTTLPSTLPTSLYLGTPGSPTPSIYYDISPSISTNVYINGPVIWYVYGNLRINTNDNIYINSTGSLTIYITNNSNGRFRVESGSGGITNRAPSSTNPSPQKLVIIGDTTSTLTHYYNYTGAPFYGVIYLPNTNTANGLTIADNVTLYGAISAKTVTFSGAANLHYDTSLRYATFQGIDTPFQIDHWRELTDTTERAVLP